MQKEAMLRIQIPSEFIDYVEDLTEGLRTSQSNMVTWLLEQGIVVNYYAQEDSDLGDFCRCIQSMHSDSNMHERNSVFSTAYNKIRPTRKRELRRKNTGDKDPWFVVRMSTSIKSVIENMARERNITKSKAVRELLRVALNMHAIVGLLMQDGRGDMAATGVRYYEAIRDTWIKDVTDRGRTASITLQIGRPEPFDVATGRRVDNPNFKNKRVTLKEIMVNG